MSSNKWAECWLLDEGENVQNESQGGVVNEEKFGGSHKRIRKCNINFEEHTNNKQSTYM
jgi:hypothetical protein